MTKQSQTGELTVVEGKIEVAAASQLGGAELLMYGGLLLSAGVGQHVLLLGVVAVPARRPHHTPTVSVCHRLHPDRSQEEQELN